MRLRAVPVSLSLSYTEFTPNQRSIPTSLQQALRASRQRRFFACLALGRRRFPRVKRARRRLT